MDGAIGDRDVRTAAICLGIAGVDRPADTAAVCDLKKNPNENKQYVIDVKT